MGDGKSTRSVLLLLGAHSLSPLAPCRCRYPCFWCSVGWGDDAPGGGGAWGCWPGAACAWLSCACWAGCAGSACAVTSIASGSLTDFLKPLIALPNPSPSCGILPAPKIISTMIKISSNSIQPNDPNIVRLFSARFLHANEGLFLHERG